MIAKYVVGLLALYNRSKALAEGINCEGSSECSNLGGDSMGDLQNAMQAGLGAGQGNYFYNTGQQVACVCGQNSANPGGGESGICAFYQMNQAQGTLSNASALVALLQKHDCTNCGSVPVSGTDISKGELTVNYVSAPSCCNGASGKTSLVCPQATSSPAACSYNPTPTSTPPTTTSSCEPSNPPVPGPTGTGVWGEKFVVGCDPNNAPFGAYGDTPYPTDSDCENFDMSKPWDSIILSRAGGMQIQLFAKPDCDPCGGCSALGSDYGGDNDLPHSCISNIGSSKGNFFARSGRIVQNGSADGRCAAF